MSFQVSVVARLTVLAVLASLVTAIAISAPAEAAQVRAARNVAAPAAQPLPKELRPNRGLPAGVKPASEPPRLKADGKPVSRAKAAALDSAEGVTKARIGAAAVGPQAVDEAPLDKLRVRPGYLLGTTSIQVFFADDVAGDPNWTSWYGTAVDEETGAEQRSITTTKANTGPCVKPLAYCQTLGATDGWVLSDAKQYRVKLTMIYADGRQVETALSKPVTPRFYNVTPAVPDAQAAGCACPNAFTRDPGPQALRGGLVNTATGAMVRTESDLAMTSFGLPFEANRIYSSRNSQPGMFGPGWSWTYDVRVVSSAGPDVRIQAEDGAQAVFNADGAGGFTRPAGVDSTLTKVGTGWQLHTADQRDYLFNAAGRLLSVKNKRGYGITLAYSTAGALTSLKDAAGRTVQVATNANQRITRLTLPDGRSVAYTYNADGRLVSYRDAALFTWQYGYNAAGQLATVTDPLGRPEITVTYAANRVTSQADALGNTTTFAWNATTQQATTTDADGVKYLDEYRANVLQRSSVLDPTGRDDNVVTARYDGRLHRNLTVDAEFNQTRTTVDDDGNVVATQADDDNPVTETNTYDARNNLTAHKDRNGNTWTYTWNDQNELTGQEDANKQGGYTYTRDSRGLVTARTDPMGHKTTYEYDSAGNRTAEITATGRRTEFQYDSTGRRVGVTDPRGTGADKLIQGPLHTVRTTYDALDRVVRVYEPGNLLPSEVTYDAAGQQILASDPLKRTTRNEYDRAGRLTATFDAALNRTRYAYTAAGRDRSVTDAQDNVLSWTYDGFGRQATETTPRGNQLGGVNAAAAAPYVTRFTYDKRGNRRVSSRPNPGGGGAEVVTTYDALGRPVTQQDQLQHSSTLEYDGNGNITNITNEKGQELKYAYDAAGRRTGADDGTGPESAARIEYNKIGDPTRQTLPGGGIVTWKYDDDGRTTAITEPRGNVAGATAADFTTTYTYDKPGNLTSTRDPLGNTTSYEYDAQDRVIRKTNPDDSIVRYAYDDADQVFAVAGPVKGAVADALSQLFLAKVNLISGKGPVNGTILTLSGLDAPVTFALGQITGVPMTRYGYDLNGNLLVTSDQLGRIDRTLYDNLNRPSASADPLGRARAYGYDADSNLTTLQTASNVPGLALTDADRERRTITNTYDGLGRLTRRALGADGPRYTYGYDANSRLVNATDPGGASTYTYDDSGLLTNTTRNGRTFGYQYDDDDNVTKRTYPDGTVVDAKYDSSNRMSESTTTRNGSAQKYTFGYDVSNNLVRTTFPASVGGQETRAYDRAGRLAQVAATTGAGVETGYALTRDSMGNPTRVDTTRRTSAATPRTQETVSYAYDESQRLTAACYGSTTCGTPLLDRSAERYDYTYDQVGNRTTQTHTVGADLTKKSVTTYGYDLADQLLTKTTVGAGAGVTLYGYDGEGNQTRDGADRSVYNLDHTLASATTTGQTTEFTYDPMGNRVTGSGGTPGTTRNYDWDINNSLPMLAVETGAGALNGRAYSYGQDGATLGLYDGGGAAGHPYLHDWLGGTAALVGSNGAAEWSYNYDPFGNARGTGGPTAGLKLAANAPDNPLQFAGGYNDAGAGGQAGNYHLRARDYDTETGRFTGTDPKARSVGNPNANNYGYVDNRSTAFTDPSGMDQPSTADMTEPRIQFLENQQEQEGLSKAERAQIDQLQAQQAAAEQSVNEAESFTKQLGDEIISLVMDLIGVTDAVNCVKNGDVGACLNTVLTAVPWGKMFKAAKVLIKSVGLAKRLVEGYSRLKAAVAALGKVRDATNATIDAIRIGAKERKAEALRQTEAALAKTRDAVQAGKNNARHATDKVDDLKEVKPKRPVRDRMTAGCPPAQSFTDSARVVMADGSTKPIAKVKPGDQVLSAPQDGAEQGPSVSEPEGRAVTVRITSHAKKQLIDLKLVGAGAGGGGPPETLSVTSGHPMFVAGQGWVGADELKVGDRLVDSAGRPVKVLSAERREAVASVYNFTIADRHTYYVKVGKSPAVLVHNSSIQVMQGAIAAPAAGEACKVAFKESQQLVQQAAREQAAQGADVLLGSLSQASQEAVAREGWLRSPMLGHAVHDGTAARLNELFKGRFTYNRSRGPDFTDTWTGAVVELTTPGQVGAHLARGGAYETVTYATYALPK
ncbi:polymorphic toxin-type HINT domain-containing protein [Spongisporangium articulatum]|uniref:Polymorphic toxin-type HINT domain-containing protein n=1 Tax=Spongisporangium articulatum TaxID=3362603 RepID=A0ABW8ARF5_9ACTN